MKGVFLLSFPPPPSLPSLSPLFQTSLSLPSHLLPLSFPSPPFQSASLRSRAFWSQLEVWGSAVSSPSGKNVFGVLQSWQKATGGNYFEYYMEWKTRLDLSWGMRGCSDTPITRPWKWHHLIDRVAFFSNWWLCLAYVVSEHAYREKLVKNHEFSYLTCIPRPIHGDPVRISSYYFVCKNQNGKIPEGEKAGGYI